MKKILLTTIATTLIATTIGGVAQAKANDGYSGNTNIWAWNANIPPLKAAAKLFMKAHPNAHVKITLVGHEALLEKLSVGLIAHGKGLPDATLIPDDHLASFVHIYPSSFVNVGKMGMDKLANLFPKYKVGNVTYKSHMYGFPLDGGPAMVFYRRSIFAKAGVKPSQIKTWDDFFKYGKIIKAKTGKYMLGGSEDDRFYRIMMAQYGKGYFDAKGNIDLRSPQSIHALKLIQKMGHEGILHHRAAGWTPYMRDISTSTIVAIPEGVWLVGSIMVNAPKTKGDWGVFPLPVNGDGDVAACNLGGASFIMFKKSRNKSLTYNFLKYYTTTTEAQLISFKKGGLFPTLQKVYKTKEFNASMPFFKGQNVWKEASKTVNTIKRLNYTSDYYYANMELHKLYTGIVFSDIDVVKRLEKTITSLKARTGRKVNQY